MASNKEQRFEELSERLYDEAQPISREEITEQVQLYYELNPDEWQKVSSGSETPQEHYDAYRQSDMYK